MTVKPDSPDQSVSYGKRSGCIPDALEDALGEAAELCSQRKGLLTPLRRKVLTLLLEAERPVKAYDMLGQLKDDGDAKPPTVYRALDFLVEMGLVHRIASLQAFAPCKHWRHEHTACLLVCDGCGLAAELDIDDVMVSLTGEAATVDFKPEDAVIEVHGLCRVCQPAE